MPIRLIMVFVLSIANAMADTRAMLLAQSAVERTSHQIRYSGRYYSISYPGGDVPKSVGVCTDVVILSYRKLGIDLQVLVHEDIQKNFDVYPSRRLWGLMKPDANIDHRRVPNLQVFFARKGTVLPISSHAKDYAPGDIVTWMLPGGLPHIGIVSDQYHPNTAHPLVVHNIGAGPKLEDMLFLYRITGHYRYLPAHVSG